MWIFIEREITHEKLFKLGKEKLITNNVLFLEINSQGILVKKEFYDINEMNDLKMSSLETKAKYSPVLTFITDIEPLTPFNCL